jgi:purine-binding chemotaxis protein CheW
MVDLAKIRKKAKKLAEPAAERTADVSTAGIAEGTAGVPPAGAAVSSPLSPPPVPPPLGGEDAAVPAGVDAIGPQALSKLDRFKAEAGKRRGTDAAKIEAASVAQLELLTFVIAGEHYAVDIERIVEIVTPRRLTRIPNAEASVVGIISLRGTIVTLVDVRKKLRHGKAGEDTADTRIVVIDFHNEIVGFLVDQVLRVVKAAAGEIEPHPVVHATELDDAVRGVFRFAGALTILLDLDRLLDHRALDHRALDQRPLPARTA